MRVSFAQKTKQNKSSIIVSRSNYNIVTYFTDLVYLLIRFSVGSGDCAPFVGHNAFLRWKAIQSVSFYENGVEKFWSECHVSEDFDMSLRLQTAGFNVRLATYGTQRSIYCHIHYAD